MPLLRRVRLSSAVVLMLFGVLVLRVAPSAAMQANPNTSSVIAYVSNEDGDDDIYLLDIDRDFDPVKVTNDDSAPARDWNPAWSPDGLQLAFNSDRDGRIRIYVINDDRTELHPFLLDDTHADDYAPTWSADGKRIAFVSTRAGVGFDLYAADANGQNLTRLTTLQTIMGDPAWSPDGQWIAFWHIEANGDINIYKLSIATGALTRLTTAGPHNGMPAWSPDSKEIYFDSDRKDGWHVWSMGANGDSPHMLQTDLSGFTGRATLSPDGQRIIFVSNQAVSDELYVMNLDQTGLRRLTENVASDHSAAWQPVTPVGLTLTYLDRGAAAVEPTPTTPQRVISTTQSVNGIDFAPLTIPATFDSYGVTGWQQAGWTGTGIKIAVIDYGFSDLDQIEQKYGIEVTLPPTATQDNYSHHSQTRHGTDALEIVHNTAPGATLYACRYDGDFETFKVCAEFARQNKVNIVNHSMGVPALPLDGTNDWAKLVDDLFKDNILWVNSAGNFQRGFEITNYTDSDGDHRFDFTSGTQNPNILQFANKDGYRGFISLTWEATMITNAKGEQEPVDFNLEVISLNTNQVIATSHRDQQHDATASPSEFLSVDTHDAFGVRITNPDQSFDVPVKMALFIEDLPIPGASNRGSIIAPADAEFSLTIGSVQNATRQIAAYSSVGMEHADKYDKPDLVAPGEFNMPDKSLFAGTSAAAPFVAGATALIMQQRGGTPISETFFDLLQSQFVQPGNGVAYGHGVFTMPPPPSINLAANVPTDVKIDPFTVFPESAAVATTTAPEVCSGAQPIRLAIGARGYVTYNLGLAMRADASQTSGQLATLDFSEPFRVTDGPKCNRGLNWWDVELEDGSVGWLAEGGDYYFLTPENLERARLPVAAQVCPHAPPTHLELGGRGEVVTVPRGGLTLWRSRNLRFTVGILSTGTDVELLGGPYCASDDDNVLQWYVRILNGQWEGHEGYTSEAITDERWMDVLPTS